MSDDIGWELASEPLSVLLDMVEAQVRRYVVLTKDQACAVSLWVVHTWAIDFAYCTPYLDIHSPEKRSGKTRLLEVLDTLVAKPWLTGGTSKAALVRKVDATEPTLLLDESDAAFSGDHEYAEALRGVLNNGYTRGKHYTTCIGQGAGIKPHDFKVFGAKAIAGIGALPDTVADRSIPIELKRRAPSERVERFRQRRAEAEGARLANALDQLRQTGGFAPLDCAEPDLPDELDDRAQDVWEGLFAIADMAGEDWPDRAREAAKRLRLGTDPGNDSLGVRLLVDIREAFGSEDDQLTTAELRCRLNAMEESAWGGWNAGEGIRPREIANKLRPYGVGSQDIHVDEDGGRRTRKGYRKADFEDAWERYFPVSGDSKRAKRANGSNKPETGSFQARQDPLVARIENPEKPLEQADGADGADRSPDKGELRDCTGAQTPPPESTGRSTEDEMRAMGLDPIPEREA
jgi:hypothetical protein